MVLIWYLVNREAEPGSDRRHLYPVGMDAAQAMVYAMGLTFSVVGIVMWAWNEFGVWLLGVAQKTARRWIALARSMLAQVGLGRHHVVLGAATATIKASMFAAAYATLGDDASLERKVEFLLAGYGDHEVKLQHLRRDIREAVDQALADSRNHVADQLKLLRAENIWIRRPGVALSLVGMCLLAAAPFVS